jgi:hypothetical protein
MKSKFVLTEEESKRILTLHKEKISEQLGTSFTPNPDSALGREGQKMVQQNPKTMEIVKQVKEKGYLTLPQDIMLEKSEGSGFLYELKLFKNSVFKKSSQPGILVSDTNYSLVGSFFGSAKTGTKKGRIIYTCNTGKFKVKGNNDDQYFNENYPILRFGFKQLCKMSQGGGGTTTPPPKSKEDVKQRAIKCGWKTVEEYKNSGWKCKQLKGGGGDTTGGEGNTGGSRGTTYPFDYNTILAAINKKCKGGGGGGDTGTPEDNEIINPFGQGGEEQQQQVMIVTDEIYAAL